MTHPNKNYINKIDVSDGNLVEVLTMVTNA